MVARWSSWCATVPDITVYANLRNVSVRQGQKVGTGQTLGTVGSDGVLQFQLRKETAKLNPESWLR